MTDADIWKKTFVIVLILAVITCISVFIYYIGIDSGTKEIKKKYNIKDEEENTTENLEEVSLQRRILNKFDKIRERIFGISKDKEDFWIKSRGFSVYPEKIESSYKSYDFDTGKIKRRANKPKTLNIEKQEFSSDFQKKTTLGMTKETKEKAMTIKDYLPSAPTKEQKKWFENYEDEKVVNDSNLINTYVPMSVPSSGFTVKNIYDLRETIPNPVISTYWNNTSKDPVVPRRAIVDI